MHIKADGEQGLCIPLEALLHHSCPNKNRTMSVASALPGYQFQLDILLHKHSTFKGLDPCVSFSHHFKISVFSELVIQVYLLIKHSCQFKSLLISFGVFPTQD